MRKTNKAPFLGQASTNNQTAWSPVGYMTCEKVGSACKPRSLASFTDIHHKTWSLSLEWNLT